MGAHAGCARWWPVCTGSGHCPVDLLELKSAFLSSRPILGLRAHRENQRDEMHALIVWARALELDAALLAIESVVHLNPSINDVVAPDLVEVVVKKPVGAVAACEGP
eukprot:3353531-Pyramimonas_sp.AAC.1